MLRGIDKLHTTELGTERIRKNLKLEAQDAVAYCKAFILRPEAVIERRGKNWYVSVDGIVITVNAYSYTIITAH